MIIFTEYKYKSHQVAARSVIFLGLDREPVVLEPTLQSVEARQQVDCVAHHKEVKQENEGL